MIQTRHILLALVLALTLGVLAWVTARGGELFASRQPLRIATWNLEWLVEPETARVARIACRERQDAALPCDVARSLARDSADFRRLAALARRLDADVVAFQEVHSAAAARRVFRGYDICIASGAGVQHTGFAVRSGVPFECGPSLQTLTAGGRGRPGQLLTLLPPNASPIALLTVHLKSGCAREPLDAPTAACRLLTEQARALGDWIHDRLVAGQSFIVLGDLNRGGTPDAPDAFWSQLHPEAFEAAASHLPYSNCVFGAPYVDFIDHILVSRDLLPQLDAEGFRHMGYAPAEATAYRLSDHCPVSVSLWLPAAI